MSSFFRSPTRALTVTALALSLGMAAGPLDAQDDTEQVGTIDQAARLDLGGITSGVSAVILHRGDLDIAAAWGTPGPDERQELNAQYLYAWPAFTEMMLAATVRALGDAGQLPVDRPIGQWLPNAPALLELVTLDQLLTHRAGIDDAEPVEGMTWDNLLESLPTEARFAPPGSVFSWSRYSYPLVGRILETALGASVAEIAQFAIIGPLGMSRTTFDRSFAEAGGLAVGTAINGVEEREAWQLPVAYTSATDAAQYFAAWMGGAIRGSAPGVRPQGTVGPIFRDGVWVSDYSDFPYIYRDTQELGFSVGMELYPETTTALVFWGNGSGPRALRTVLSQELYFELGILGMDPEGFPASAPLDDDWEGTYMNGDRMVVLRSGGGGLVAFDGNRELPIVPTDDGHWAAMLGQQVAFTFRTMEVGTERVIYLGSRAYLQQ